MGFQGMQARSREIQTAKKAIQSRQQTGQIADETRQCATTTTTTITKKQSTHTHTPQTHTHTHPPTHPPTHTHTPACSSWGAMALCPSFGIKLLDTGCCSAVPTGSGRNANAWGIGCAMIFTSESKQARAKDECTLMCWGRTSFSFQGKLFWISVHCLVENILESNDAKIIKSWHENPSLYAQRCLKSCMAATSH